MRAAATVIGWLAFRFGISGTYFALLTIAFAEFTRIGFDHFDWVGGSGGFFLKVVQQGRTDLLNLRGHPRMFYFLALALAAGAFVLSAWLMRSRAGYYFRAIRDNEDAARAAGVDTFRYKMIAIQISAALTALAGVFFAFYYNNLFPEQIFNMGRSIEIILAPIIGGVGTLFGPVIGAALLTLLSEGVTEAAAGPASGTPGLKQILYGVALGLSIMFMPHGVWPGIARRLGPRRATPRTRANERLAAARRRAVSKSFRGLRAVADASIRCAQGEIVALIGPNGAGKTTLFNLIAGRWRRTSGVIRFDGRDITGLRADQVCAAGIGRTFQIVKPFADMTVLDNAMVGGFRGKPDARVARARARAALRRAAHVTSCAIAWRPA